MKVNVIKMHGLGNDYIFINALTEIELFDIVLPYIPKLCDRHFGVGGDGVILLMPSDKADCRMRMFNSDASEGMMCGNGIRQLAKLLWDNHIIKKTSLLIETGNGLLPIELTIDQTDRMEFATVNMGSMDFNPKNIPFFSPDNLTFNDMSMFTYCGNDGNELLFYVGGIGSKHAVCFIEEDVTIFDFCSVGKNIERNTSLFPEGVNVEFVNVLSPVECIMRVWERGTGHTLACGTGATFVVGVGQKLGFFDKDSTVKVQLEGGDLFIFQQDNAMFMKGSATLVFEGIVDLDNL